MNRVRGVTLLELIIVLVVVAILAAVAYPSYSHHVRKGARKEAMVAMLDLAGRMERIRTQLFKYQSASIYNTQRYQFTVTVPDDGGSFVVTAAPNTNQAADPCGTIALNSKGSWSFSKEGNTVSNDECL